MLENIFVLLLEHEQESVLPFFTYHDRLKNLTKELQAYAKRLHDFIGRYFSDEDNIKKLVTDVEYYKEFSFLKDSKQELDTREKGLEQ